MTEYRGPFARIYDALYSEKPYSAEAAAVHRLLAANGVGSPGKLLDLACGTGRHALEFALLGWDVTAVDLSDEMLQLGKARSEQSKSNVRFVNQDMRSLSLGEPFDAVVSLFDSIGYAGSERDVVITLERVREHLSVDGVFVFEAWHAPAMIASHDPVRIRYIDDGKDGQVVRISETSIDEKTSIATVRFTFFVPDDHGRYERYIEVHKNMFFTVPKLKDLLTAAGLTAIGWHGGLLEGTEVDEATWHVVGVAKSMRVAVYAGRTPPEGGGGFTFEESVLEALLAASNESRHSFLVLGSGSPLDRAREAGVEALSFPDGGIRRGLLRSPRLSLASSRRHQRPVFHAGFDTVVTRSGADFLLCLGPEVPSLSLPYSMVVWDLQHRLQPFFPEVSNEGVWERREKYFSRVLPRAAFVVVGTGVGEEEVSAFYGVPRQRILVLPHPTPAFALDAAEQGLEGRAPSGVPEVGPFVFYPAQFWPHKNHVSLIDAIRLLRERQSSRCSLVLVGSDWGDNRDFVQSAAGRLLGEDVVFLNFVERDELIWLYRRATALVYPSLFGPENLPPLEAFALGCPVVAADVEGAQEQLGDAALLVDGTDVDLLAEAIATVITDDAKRSLLIDRGLQRAQRSTPESFARGLIDQLDRFEKVRRNWPSSETPGTR